MFDHQYYVPIMRWKLGERIALRELLESDRQAIVPLIEISHDFVHKRPEFFNTSRFIKKGCQILRPVGGMDLPLLIFTP